MVSVRCSSLDRIMACSGSLTEPKHPYNPQSDEAREGTAGHAALAVMISGGKPDLEAIADEHRVGADALSLLMSRGRLAWEQVGHWFPNARAERHMEAVVDGETGLVLTGTADVISIADTVAVLDWKCGWLPSDHPHQVNGYGYLGATALAAERPSSKEDVIAIEAHLRAGTIEVHRWSREDLDTWARSLVDQVGRAGSQWGPGPVSCQYCPHQTACSARDAYVQGAAIAIAPLAAAGSMMTPERVIGLWDRSRELKRALARYETVVGEILRAGAYPLDEARQLCLLEVERDKIIPSKAMSHMRETMRLTPEEANLCLKVSKGKLCDVAKSRVPKGKGAGAVRELLAALDAKDAIVKTTHTEKRVIKRAKES